MSVIFKIQFLFIFEHFRTFGSYSLLPLSLLTDHPTSLSVRFYSLMDVICLLPSQHTVCTETEQTDWSRALRDFRSLPRTNLDPSQSTRKESDTPGKRWGLVDRKDPFQNRAYQKHMRNKPSRLDEYKYSNSEKLSPTMSFLFLCYYKCRLWWTRRKQNEERALNIKFNHLI